MEPVVDDDERGNQAAAEEHGKHEKQRKPPAAHQIAPRQRIGHRNIDHQHDRRTRDGVQDRIAIANPQILHRGQVLIALQGDAARQQQDFALRHKRRIADGGDDDKIHGIQGRHGQDGGNGIQNAVKHAIAGQPAHVVVAPYRNGCHLLFPLPAQNSDVSPILPAIKLTDSSRMKLTTLLNRPIAAE